MFIKIFNDFYQAATIRSAKLTTESRLYANQGVVTTRDIPIFIITFADGQTMVYSGRDNDSSDEETLKGLRAFNEFASQVVSPTPPKTNAASDTPSSVA